MPGAAGAGSDDPQAVRASDPASTAAVAVWRMGMGGAPRRCESALTSGSRVSRTRVCCQGGSCQALTRRTISVGSTSGGRGDRRRRPSPAAPWRSPGPSRPSAGAPSSAAASPRRPAGCRRTRPPRRRRAPAGPRSLAPAARPSAMRSLATTTPSSSGSRVEQRVHRPASADDGEVGVGDGGGRQAERRELAAVAVEPVDGGGHVERPGDGADPGAAPRRRAAGSPRGRPRGCRRRRTRRARVRRAPSPTAGPAASPAHRRPAARRGSGSAPCSDTNATPSTWPPRANRSNRSRSAASVSTANTSCTSCAATGGVHPAQDEGEERVGEEPLLRLGHDEGDRVAAAGHQRPRGPVRDVRTARRRRAGRRRGRGR